MTTKRKRISSSAGSPYRPLVDLVTVPTLLATNSGKILAANAPACTLLGVSPRAMLGRNVSAFFGDSKALLAELSSANKPHTTAVRRTIHIQRRRKPVSSFKSTVTRLANGDLLVVLRPGTPIDTTQLPTALGGFDPINALVEGNHEFFGIANVDHRITYINRAGRIMAGLPPEGPLPTMRILDMIPEDHHAQFRDEVIPAVLHTGRWHGEGRLRRVDTEFSIPVELDVFAVVPPRGRNVRHIAAVIRDLSEHRKTEEALRRHADDLAAIHFLSTNVNASLSVEHVLSAAVNGLRSTMQCDRVFVYLRDRERFVLRNPEFELSADDAVREAEFATAESLCNRAVRDRSSLFINDLHSQDEVPPSDVTPSMLRSFAAVLVRRGAHILGVIGIGSYQATPYESRAAVLETIADTISIGLTNAMLFTTTQEAGEALRKSEERFRTLVEQTSEAIIVQTHSRFAYLNNEALRLFGATSADQLLGTPVLDRIHPDYRESVLQRIAQTDGSKKAVPLVDMVYVRLDGTYVSVESAAAPITFGGEEGSVIFAFDIEGRRASERTLRESESRLRQAQAVAHVGNWELDLRTQAIWGSDEAFRIYGVDRATSLLTLPVVQQIVVKKYRSILDNALRLLLQEGRPYEQEFEIQRADDGRTRWIYSKGELIRDSDGTPARVLGVIQDITDRKNAEMALRENEYFLRKSQEIGRIGSYDLDATSGLWKSSPVLDEIFGIGPAFPRDITGWLLLVHPDQREELQLYFTREIMQLHHRFDMTYRIVRQSDQDYRWVHGQGEIELDSEGNTIRMIGTIQDVTERTHHEMAVVAALREKEILLKEVHHRVKNNMQVISSLLSLQASKFDDLPLRNVLFESMNRIRSMALVHERLYKEQNLASIEFLDYLRNMASELARSYQREGIALEVEGEPTQLGVDLAIPCGLIANELIANAFKHAFPDGRQGKILVSLNRLPDDRAVLRVHDDGVGMAEGQDPARGETLGMTIIDALAQQIAARRTVNSTAGTDVSMEFPLR